MRVHNGLALCLPADAKRQNVTPYEGVEESCRAERKDVRVKEINLSSQPMRRRARTRLLDGTRIGIDSRDVSAELSGQYGHVTPSPIQHRGFACRLEFQPRGRIPKSSCEGLLPAATGDLVRWRCGLADIQR
jgi:hypothetical protein